jgi:HSP20 family protein
MKLTRKKRNRNNAHNQRDGWVEHNFSVPAMFDDFLTREFFRPTFANTGVSTPAVNIIETSDDFRLEMVAPGMNKNNFNVELEEDILTVSYEHEDNRQGDRRDWKYRTHEYNYHSFTRSFSLPETVDADKIEAKYENGILTLVIPKKEEARSNMRQIPIQ